MRNHSFYLELHQKPKSILSKSLPFFLNFFSPVLLKTIGNFDLPNTPTKFTFPSNEILLKKIDRAVLLPQTAMKKKKLIIVKSIE